jgi:hypothetical protein
VIGSPVSAAILDGIDGPVASVSSTAIRYLELMTNPISSHSSVLSASLDIVGDTVGRRASLIYESMFHGYRSTIYTNERLERKLIKPPDCSR